MKCTRPAFPHLTLILILGCAAAVLTTACGKGGGGGGGSDDDCEEIVEIIDETGDGETALDEASSIAVDSRGRVYVASFASDQVFEISPGGDIRAVIGPDGDGTHALESPVDLAVDRNDNLYVAGQASDNVFRRTPDGTIAQIIELADGLNSPQAVAVDDVGNVYVAGGLSSNVFRIAAGGVAISEILTSAGAGTASGLNAPSDLAVDADGNLLVTGIDSNNLIRVSPADVAEELVDVDGDGAGNEFLAPRSVATNRRGDAYVVTTSFTTRSVWRIGDDDEPEFLFEDPFDDAPGALISVVAVDRDDALYVADQNRVARLDRDFDAETLIDGEGDREGNPLAAPSAIAFGPDDELYVAGRTSNNAFRIQRCD